MRRAKVGAKENRAANEEDLLSQRHDEAIENRRLEKPESGNKAKEKVMAAALRILAARARSENQLREKLLAKQWLDHSLIEDCLARLKELGYVNDKSFAYNFALSKLRLKATGRSRLARQLMEKKVPREVIEEALDLVFEEVAEDELIDKAIAKQIRLQGLPQDMKGSRKLFAHLMRLGFGYDLIAKKMRAMRLENDESDD
jgi:regulatory protein